MSQCNTDEKNIALLKAVSGIYNIFMYPDIIWWEAIIIILEKNKSAKIAKRRQLKNVCFCRATSSAGWTAASRTACCRAPRPWRPTSASTTAARQCPSSTTPSRSIITGRTCPAPIRTTGHITRYRHTSLWVKSYHQFIIRGRGDCRIAALSQRLYIYVYIICHFCLSVVFIFALNLPNVFLIGLISLKLWWRLAEVTRTRCPGKIIIYLVWNALTRVVKVARKVKICYHKS